MENQSDRNMENDEISLKELFVKFKEWLLFLRSKWLTILLFGLIGGTIGYINASFQTPTYTATLSFALEDEKSGSGGLSGAMGLASSLGIDLGTNAGGAFTGANLIELMKSRTIVEKALLNGITENGKTISLAEYFLNFSGIREAMLKKPSLTNIHFLVGEDRINYSRQKDSILGIMYQQFIGTNGALNVAQKDKKISIIIVDVKTTNELFSKVLAETLVKEVTEFYITTKSKKARNNVAILQKQADSIRNELNNAIGGVAIAADNTFNLNSAMAVKRTPSSRRQVDVQANSAILTQLVTNLEMAKVTLMKETPLVQIIDKPILPLKNERVSKFKSLILGGILGGFVIVFVLLGIQFYKRVMNDSL